MHGWDIRSRFEEDAHLSEESLPVFIDMIPVQLERFIFRSGSRMPVSIRYRWELTGMGATSLDILVEGDKARAQPAGSEKADVTFECDTETFALITFGRLAIDTAVSANRLTIQGDDSLSLEYQRWFPGM